MEKQLCLNIGTLVFRGGGARGLTGSSRVTECKSMVPGLRRDDEGDAQVTWGEGMDHGLCRGGGVRRHGSRSVPGERRAKAWIPVCAGVAEFSDAASGLCLDLAFSSLFFTQAKAQKRRDALSCREFTPEARQCLCLCKNVYRASINGVNSRQDRV